MLKNPTNAQRVASARNEWPAHETRMQCACSAHAARMQRALNAQPANGCGQMTVPIKSDGLSCLTSYRSREERTHTRVIQHANQERKCDVSESDKEDYCSCCWQSWSRSRSRRQRQKQIELPIQDHAAVGEDAVEPLTRSPSSSLQVSPTCSRCGSEKVGYCCHRRHRREGGTRRTTSLPMTRKRRWSPSWKQTKCYGTRRRRFTGDPISKSLHDRIRLKQWGSRSPARLVQGHA